MPMKQAKRGGRPVCLRAIERDARNGFADAQSMEVPTSRRAKHRNASQSERAREPVAACRANRFDQLRRV
ncbi:hypothetical protein WS62_04710 [Burkholderia sp. ABCPW 14]|nr:hypothetical protein WS62_04710 [Burkholderia sp. ABCPW 14]